MKSPFGTSALKTGALLVSLFAVLPNVDAIAREPSGDYNIVESSRPDGKGGYRGKVSIREQGPSFSVDWNLTSGETYAGLGIRDGDVLGVGYGDGFTGLAVYHITGGSLAAKWLLPTAPQQVGEYGLVGPASLNGVFRFSNGMAGSVTIKPNGDTYSIVWALSTGTYTGVGIRLGDTLVAVSGTSGRLFGAVAYGLTGGERLQGLWTVAGESGVGTEVLASSAQPQNQEVARAGGVAVSSGGDGSSVRDGSSGVLFDRELYRLANSVTAPGKPTSELREFVRPTETLDDYSKLVAFRMQDGGGSTPTDFTRELLKRMKEQYPGAETNEIGKTDDSSTVEFLIISGQQVEYDLWHYFRTPSGLASVQFVLRNRGAYDTEQKFKAEREGRVATWVSDAQGLAPQVVRILGQTRK